MTRPVLPLVYDHKHVPTNGPACLRCGADVRLHVGAWARWRWRREEARWSPCYCGCGRTLRAGSGWDGMHGA